MPRPLWNGSINFGLVNIPIQLVSAVHERSVGLHILSKDGTCRLRQKLYCPDTGKEYNFNETARGVEIGPEDYVILDEREIKRLKPESGRSMEISQFVDLSAIDPVFYDRVYYVLPTEDAYKPYKLLVEAMAESKKSAVARFVMRMRQYVAVIRVLDEGLVLHTLHFSDEVDVQEKVLPEKLKHVKVPNSELEIAGQLLKAMTKPLDIESFRDEYREQLEALIEQRVKGKKTVKVADEPDEAPPRTLNLMEALKKSLAKAPAAVKPRSRHRRSA